MVELLCLRERREGAKGGVDLKFEFLSFLPFVFSFPFFLFPNFPHLFKF